MPEPQADYEIWRTNPRGPDIRLYHGLNEHEARTTLNLCNRDTSSNHYAIRVTRERVTPREQTNP